MVAAATVGCLTATRQDGVASVDGRRARGVRVAEVLVGLSAVADLGMGQPVGSAARTCYLAVALARACGCDESVAADVFLTALLQHVGCTAYSHEASLLFADELSIKSAALVTDFDRPGEVLGGYLPRIVREAPAGQRLRTARGALLHGRALEDGYSRANCEVASVLARRLGLSVGVQTGLLHIFEWWNGQGRPHRLSGDDISVAARIVNVAAVGALFDRLGGWHGATRALRQRSGRLLDPAVVDVFTATAHEPLKELGEVDASDMLLGVEPSPAMTAPDADLDDMLRAFGDAVDLKAPFLHGHSTGVARIATATATALRLSTDEVRDLGRAAYTHDLGRCAVPSGIWERTATLGHQAWSQIRLHAYHSEQILTRSATLAPLAGLAGAHHERLDGSGYHRGTRAAQLSLPARVLAVADVFQALTSDRPHRRAYPVDQAVVHLRQLARDRRLDADVVEATVGAVGAAGAAAGARVARAAAGGRAGLTARQVEVLNLLTQGLSNRAIAARLTISPRTAEHHIQDVYARIGVSSRAAAAMYAMEHGLLPQDW